MARARETYRGYRRNIRFGRPVRGNHTPALRRSIWAAVKNLVLIEQEGDNDEVAASLRVILKKLRKEPL